MLSVCKWCKETREVNVLLRLLHEGRYVGEVLVCAECWPKPITVERYSLEGYKEKTDGQREEN